MKRLLAIFTAMSMTLAMVACGASDTASGNTYKGEGIGYNSSTPIVVEISVDGTEITGFKVVSNDETPTIGGAAIEHFEKEIMSAQTLDVDIISGATLTSNAVLEAAKNALTEGGLDISEFTKSASYDNVSDETLDTEIVIVGAGGAGIVAAIEATIAGNNVVVIEKMPIVGGNTAKATGGINAAGTHIQEALDVPDTVEAFIEDTMEGGYNVNDIELVTVMAENSADAIVWLGENGAPLDETYLSYSGGASYSRIHVAEGRGAIGDYLVENLYKTAQDLGVEFYLNTEATEILLNESGEAVGILANSNSANYTINADAVILATGGFGANEEMYASYSPELAGFVTTNAAGATGDGIRMAVAIGADLTDIEQIQIHPTVNQEQSYMLTESVRGSGGILVNTSGERFTNELLTRDVVSQNIINQDQGYAYLIFDDGVKANVTAIEGYISSGLTIGGVDTIEELAEVMGVDAATLAETYNNWNSYVENQLDEEFDRTTGMDYPLTTGKLYAAQISPGVHHTMGGVKINTDTQVISTNGEPIVGLFAAGEVVGGVHGANRIGGTAVTDIVVFGRIAGTNASEFIANK